MKLSLNTLQRIETAIGHYPRKQSAVMTLLHLIQEERGFLSNAAIEWVADKLEIQPIKVLELVTFYPHYRREKLGKTRVRLCRTLPCALMGAYRVGDQLETALNCKMGRSKDDGTLTLEYAECLAACAAGPGGAGGRGPVREPEPPGVVADIGRHRSGPGRGGGIGPLKKHMTAGKKNPSATRG